MASVIQKPRMNKLTPIRTQSRPLGGWNRLRARLRSLALIVALGGVTSAAVYAGDDVKSTASSTKDIAPPALGSRITGLLNLDFSDKYITPRGLVSAKNGGSFQPLLILFLNAYHTDEKKWLTDVTFNMGVWNDIDVGENGRNPGNWDELDGFFGVEAKLFGDWKLDAEETFFKSETNSYNTTTNLDVKATYLDHWFADSGFSINPYVEVFYETSQKSTVIFNQANYHRSGYVAFGLDPTYKFKGIPLTLELPTFVNYVGNEFYQRVDGSAGGPGLAVMSTEFKATTPLSFIPISYGAWSAYAGVQYYHLNNPGVLDGNQALEGHPPGSTTQRDRDVVQYHVGLTCFF